jgi:hypothetical protein
MRSSTSRHRLGTPAALLLAAATAVGCQSSAPHQAHAHDPAPSRPTYFAQYGVSTHAYKPHRLNPSVDGSLFIGGMQWTAWDDRHAVGAGVAHVNDCKPDCADGSYTTYRVDVRLARPRELCDSRFFTAFRVRGSGYRTSAHWSGVACR